MAPLMSRHNGLWLGWPGEALPTGQRGRDALVREWEEQHAYVAVDIPARISRSFYEGFANDTLWPLLHGFPSRVVFHPESWHSYTDANERFASAVLERLRRDDLVWIHDYQLLLLPELIRRSAPNARIGFFLHIPFPASEAFRILPQREEVLRGMLGADEIAFQTHGHLHEFRRALLQVLGLESQMDRVQVDDRTVHLEALPIGISTIEWERLSTRDVGVRRRIRDLRARHTGRSLIVAVDRLDYTKGIPERLRTLRRLLHVKPEWRGKVTLIQVAVGTQVRSGVDAALDAGTARASALATVGAIDYLHRDAALVVLVGSMLLAGWLRNRWSYAVLALAGLQVGLGILMAYISLLPAAQVLHLTLASLLLGAETVLFLLSRRETA